MSTRIKSSQYLDTLPQSIKNFRTEYGVSQKKLAELLNTNEQQISRWEVNNFSQISLKRLIKLMQVIEQYAHEVNCGGIVQN